MDPRLRIQLTSSSGNGVFAIASIPANTLLLTSPAPYLSVINHTYRKEACGYCFAYNLGRRWKIRSDSETGFVFCTEICRRAWELDVGLLGMQAYVAVELLLRQVSQKGKVADEDVDADEVQPPDEAEVRAAWSGTAAAAAQIMAVRLVSEPVGARSSKKAKMPKAVSASGSPDILAFLLSGVLALQRARDDEGNISSVEGETSPSLGLDILYAAPVPYVSHSSLLAHTTAYLQLLSVLPLPLLDLVTPENLQRVTGLAYDNAFGIRSVDHVPADFLIHKAEPQFEDPGSELLGYALYPSASLFNHSCLPNVRKAREGRRWRFWSSRDIGVGEEVCITYLGGDERTMNVQERRDRLKGGWEFDCACQGCTPK